MMNLGTRIEGILESLGLSKPEASLYYYLLKKPGATVSQIARDFGLTRQRIYDLLEELGKRGVIYFSSQKPRMYFPVSPEIATSILIREKERDFYQALKLREELISTVRSCHLLKSETSNAISMEISGRRAIINFLKKFVRDAKRELMVFATRNESIRLVYELKAELDDVKASGVSLMIIAPLSQVPREIADVLKKLSEWREGEAKGRIYIKDGKEAILMPAEGSLRERAHYDCALLVANKDIVATLRSLFLAKFDSSSI
jgi:sugar-specific transcriptional regulator TrmB